MVRADRNGDTDIKTRRRGRRGLAVTIALSVAFFFESG
jgi:hypothetical protein